MNLVFALEVLACVALAFCMASCSACRPVSGDGAVALGRLSVGDRLRVRLVDGRVIHDTFVLVTDTELECKFHTFDLSRVECIGRPAPKGVQTLGTIVLVGLGSVLLAAMTSVWGPWG
jgi:hypothetical protein